MRFNEYLFDKVKTKNFIGLEKPNGRVTVDPYWSLQKTEPIYGNSFKGPFRYYTNYDASSPSALAEEYEVPAIKSISWNRSTSQDLASCTITLYNMWHDPNDAEAELAGQLGKKGYFWPKRGQGDSSVTWSQTPGSGAYKKDGTWDPEFSWENVLVEDVILRTYEGYGGNPTDGNYVSIDENLSDGNVLLTGVWIVNSISAGSNGMLTLECTDIGRILIDQIVFPPVIPGAAYPLEYYPPGKSPFDSPWGPKLKNKELVNDSGEVVVTTAANRGEVWIRSFNSSADSDGTVNSTYPASAATDGDWDTYTLSEAYETMDGGRPYWEFLPGADPNMGAGINSIKLKTWGGGYTVYVSIAEDPDPDHPSSTSVWKGVDTIPGGGIKYIKKVVIPLQLPDGMESPIDIDLADYPEEDDPFTRPTQNTYYAHKVRLTFENLSYSHVPDGTKRYRAGIRDLVFFRDGLEFSDYTPDEGLAPWAFAIEQHPTRGYWVVDSTGRVHGFGDASDYDWNRFGDVPINSYGANNRAVGIAAHPSGEGYWVVDWMGHVWAFGEATDYGEYTVPDPYVTFAETPKVQVRGIASTHTGDGYWVVYSNGIIRGFGDATPSYSTIPTTDISVFMDAFLDANYTPGTYIPYSIGLKATAIASHPTKMGFWVTDGSGQVWAFGQAVNHGELKNRVYNPGLAGRFKLQNLEWATALEATPSGDGYWIGFGSGRVGSFGDATSLGKDPYVVDAISNEYEENIITTDDISFDNSFFRKIMWGLARDPSGKGFWVLTANGDVIPYEADFWGQPGYTGLTGYKWHDGNFNGDWANIVKEILMWGGFLFYDPEISGSPAVNYTTTETRTGMSLEDVGGDPLDGGSDINASGGVTIIPGPLTTFQGLIWENPVTPPDPDAVITGIRFSNVEVFGTPSDFLFLIQGSDGVGQIPGSSSISGPGASLWENSTINAAALCVGVGDPATIELTFDPPLTAGDTFPPGTGFVFVPETSPVLPTSITTESIEWLWEIPAISPSNIAPSVLGNIESTGIITDTTVPGDKFDKKTLMDVIKELTEVVGYRFRIDEEGRAIYASPNFWRAGNFDQNGLPIYVDELGDRVDPETEGAQPFIPIIHESEDLLDYTARLSSTDKRSEIIIGTDIPNPKDPSTTGYIIHQPPHTLETVAGGVNTMRGIERTAIWISQLFENEEERKLMAELIGLHAWFAGRTGSSSIIGNPALSIDDQVRIIERNTSETFIHLITGLDSNLDLDTGVYTMSLTTNWLGTADDWVISSVPKESEYIYTVISENLNAWQIKTNRGLGTDGGSFDSPLASFSGGFDTAVAEVSAIAKMVVLGDSLSYLDSTLDGLTGDRWPNLLEDSGAVTTVYNGAMSGYTSQDLIDTPIVAPGAVTGINATVIFIGANDQNESLSGVSPSEFYDNIDALLADYPAGKQLVVFPWKWTGYPEGEPDPAPTLEEYNNYATQAQQAAEDNEALFLHMGNVVEALAEAAGESDWNDYIVDEIHASTLGHELIAERVSSALHVSFGADTGWSFTGTLTTVGEIDNLTILVDVLSNLGTAISFEMYDSSDTLIDTGTLISNGQVLSVGPVGTALTEETYTIVISGSATSRGTGSLKLSFRDGSNLLATTSDTILFLESE